MSKTSPSPSDATRREGSPRAATRASSADASHRKRLARLIAKEERVSYVEARRRVDEAAAAGLLPRSLKDLAAARLALTRSPRSLGTEPDPSGQAAAAGSRLGDEAGVRVGVDEDEHAVWLDPCAATAANLPPVTFVVGAPGSGKTYFAQALAAQVPASGVPSVYVSTAVGDQLPAFARLLGGVAVRYQVGGELTDVPGALPGQFTVVELEVAGHWPSPDVDPSAHSGPERAAAMAVAVAMGGWFDALTVAGGGTLVIDDVDALVGAPATRLMLVDLVRRARSGNVHLVLVAQRPWATGCAGLAAAASRVFVFRCADPHGAHAALCLLGVEPTGDRVAWLLSCGPRRHVDGTVRSASVWHRDLSGRAGRFTVEVPASVHRAFVEALTIRAPLP